MSRKLITRSTAVPSSIKWHRRLHYWTIDYMMYRATTKYHYILHHTASCRSNGTISSTYRGPAELLPWNHARIHVVPTSTTTDVPPLVLPLV